MNNHDNSWFSDRTKTIIVTVTMTILVVGMAWGYYAGYQWQQERKHFDPVDQAYQILLEEQAERIQESEPKE